MSVGIEAINCYVGRATIDVKEIFEARQLSMERMQNLMMVRKSVNLPIEDPVTNAVNAAKPILDEMDEDEIARIELVVIGTESGIDFGKPISTYVAHHLGLPKNCRSFEVKHACYGGTAALQTAAAIVAANPRPGSKALVIAADASSVAARNTYWEPSQGAGAVAMIVGDTPSILALDRGASGFYSFEVMDTLRPRPDLEAGDSDLSILSYMRCLDESFSHYCRLVEGVDLSKFFEFLIFHSPFAGLVKSAHKKMMFKNCRSTGEQIEEDFAVRVGASLRFCQEIGNIYSASVYLGLCSLLEHGQVPNDCRIGLFSYGSGCASEFYSGVIGPESQRRFRGRAISDQLRDRVKLDWHLYEAVCDLSLDRMAGVENVRPDTAPYREIVEDHFHGLLVLDEVRDFHRRYRFV